MKFRGFSNAALNLGFVELQLATANKLDLLCCDTCGFSTKEMFSCDCNHVFCGSCLLVLEDADDDAHTVMAHCVICQCPTLCMSVKLHETFVSQLQFLCPHCAIVVRLNELKGHLKCCVPPGKSASISALKLVAAAAKKEQFARISNMSTNSLASSPETASPFDDQAAGDTTTSGLIDTRVTASIVNTVRRELIEMFSKSETGVRTELDALRKDFVGLAADWQKRADTKDIHVLAFRYDDLYQYTLTTSTVTVGNTSFSFKCYCHSSGRDYKEVRLVIAGVAGGGRTDVFKVGISCDDYGAWAAPIKNTVRNATIGGWISFSNVFKFAPTEGTRIRVQFEKK